MPDLGTVIIRNDDQLDALVASRALRSEQVVVNPVLGLDGSPLAGAWFDPEVLWLGGLNSEVNQRMTEPEPNGDQFCPGE